LIGLGGCCTWWRGGVGACDHRQSIMVIQVVTINLSSISGSCYDISIVGLSTGVVLIAKWWEDVVWMHIYLHQGVAGGK